MSKRKICFTAAHIHITENTTAGDCLDNNCCHTEKSVRELKKWNILVGFYVKFVNCYTHFLLMHAWKLSLHMIERLH